MQSVQIFETGAVKIAVKTPYHPDFSTKAKKLGGRWDPYAKQWLFDARDIERVRELCRNIYGNDGSPVPRGALLTIRASAKICDGRHSTFGGSRPTSYWLAGRQIASVSGRDSGARLGDGVVLVSGSFSSGGSVKNPACNYTDKTVFELRDVPREMAEKIHSEYHGVTLLDADGAIVAEPTSEPVEISVPDPFEEMSRIDLEIAAAEGRIAGLRFRAAELKAS